MVNFVAQQSLFYNCVDSDPYSDRFLNHKAAKYGPIWIWIHNTDFHNLK